MARSNAALRSSLAFQPAPDAGGASSVVVSLILNRSASGLVQSAPARPRRRVQRPPAATSRWRASRSTTAGRASRSCRRSRPRSRSTPRARSSPATTRPTSPSTARSIPIAAASTAASTASPGRPTPILGLSPGLDFETKLFKPDAPKLLSRAHVAEIPPRTIAIGTKTDPYQPIERKLRRCAASRRAGRPQSGGHRHQDRLVTRDIDILRAWPSATWSRCVP